VFFIYVTENNGIPAVLSPSMKILTPEQLYPYDEDRGLRKGIRTTENLGNVYWFGGVDSDYDISDYESEDSDG